MRAKSIIPMVVLLIVLCGGCGSPYHPTRQPSPSPDATGPTDSEEAREDLVQPHGNAGVTDPHATIISGNPHARVDLTVSVGSIQLTGPAQWIREEPRSPFLAAEFELPREDGDESDGRLTLSVAGGDTGANIERWRGQFGGEPKRESREELEVNGVPMTIVDLAGTFYDQPSPLMPALERKSYRMWAVILRVGQQIHFIKAYGPEKTMAKHEAAFREFLQTIKVP